MSDKFTAGPWSRDQYGTLLDANGSTVLFRGVSIAASGSRVAEAEANTDLIAAVHDMLEALRWAVNNPDDNAYWLERAYAALTKAGAKP